MKKHALLPLLLAALLGGVAQAADCTPPEGFLPATSTAPLSELIKRDGKKPVVLLNVWAVWCAPCRSELPLLDKIYEELQITALPRDNHGDHTLLKTLGGVGLPLSVWYKDGQMIAKSAGALHDGDALTAYARCLSGDEGKQP